VGDFTLGLLLLPDEISLFDEDDLEPMWGIGLKGRSRPRPEAVAVVQLNRDVCPHVSPENLCLIYEKRPQICRAHPLTLRITQDGEVESASYSKRCPAIKGLPSNHKITLGEHFSMEMIRATAALNTYFNSMFKKSGGLLWVFDLESKKWWRVDPQTVMRNLYV